MYSHPTLFRVLTKLTARIEKNMFTLHFNLLSLLAVLVALVVWFQKIERFLCFCIQIYEITSIKYSSYFRVVLTFFIDGGQCPHHLRKLRILNTLLSIIGQLLRPDQRQRRYESFRQRSSVPCFSSGTTLANWRNVSKR